MIAGTPSIDHRIFANIDEIVRALNIGTRTLQRQLREAGLDYRSRNKAV